MPRQTQEIPITPAVLRWARETRGYSQLRASDALGINVRELMAIESTAETIPAPLFSKMLSAYKQVRSVLLLPDVPDHDPLPRDFRTAKGGTPSLKLETRMAIREARRFQHAISDLAADERELVPHANIPQATLADSPDEFAASERGRFNIPMASQQRWRASSDDDEAFRKWRARAQELGIFVLLKQMPWKDCRGLSLWDNDLLPVVVVNSQDVPAARPFTLFHEYGHLILRESATCLLRVGRYGTKDRIERWCNRFAAAFLMPADHLRATIEKSYFYLRPQDWAMRDVERLARVYKVSRVAMAIRLKELHITALYDQHKDELFSFDKRRERKKEGGKGGPPQHAVRLSELGSGAATIVLDALHGEAIDAFEAAEILDLAPNQLGSFRERTEHQRSRDAPT